jgi:hypothetical protein
LSFLIGFIFDESSEDPEEGQEIQEKLLAIAKEHMNPPTDKDKSN